MIFLASSAEFYLPAISNKATTQHRMYADDELRNYSYNDDQASVGRLHYFEKRSSRLCDSPR